LADVDRVHGVREPELLERDRGLAAVRGGPGVEIDHGSSPLSFLKRRDCAGSRPLRQGPKTQTAAHGTAVCFNCVAPRQCAVSVEESSSTAGSVVTEVWVGLAFSSSHSIASGARVSALARTSSIRETGMISRPFLMLSLISTRSLAFSSG